MILFILLKFVMVVIDNQRQNRNDYAQTNHRPNINTS